jgi:hypothetical protein
VTLNHTPDNAIVNIVHFGNSNAGSTKSWNTENKAGKIKKVTEWQRLQTTICYKYLSTWI